MAAEEAPGNRAHLEGYSVPVFISSILLCFFGCAGLAVTPPCLWWLPETEGSLVTSSFLVRAATKKKKNSVRILQINLFILQYSFNLFISKS